VTEAPATEPVSAMTDRITQQPAATWHLPTPPYAAAEVQGTIHIDGLGAPNGAQP
jgi:hypothetical protein